MRMNIMMVLSAMLLAQPAMAQAPEMVADEVEKPEVFKSYMDGVTAEIIALKAQKTDMSALLTHMGKSLGAIAYVKHACGNMSYRELLVEKRKEFPDNADWKQYSDGYRAGWKEIKLAYIKAQSDVSCGVK